MIGRLEAEIARQLQPVSAPEELWERIQGDVAAVRPISSPRWPLWAIAAAAAATLALCFSLRSATSPDLEKLADRELASGVSDLDLRSDDPAQIRSWLKTHAGLDVPLPATRPGSLQLIGVRLLGGDQPVACISYRVGGRITKLLVTRGTSAARHGAAQPANGFITWSLNRQTYALASTAPREASGACILCHLERTSPRS